MSDKDAKTPRVFLVRHGETEWTKTGQYTGTTDLELTAHGVKQVSSTAAQLVGPGKFLDPAHVSHVFVSPRKRAKQTFQLLFGNEIGSEKSGMVSPDRIVIEEDIAEWDCGDYEGLLGSEIKALRKKKGLDQETSWSIWRDGCEGGESAEQTKERLDRLISKIREIQRPYMHGEKPVNVVLVAHGVIGRAFVKRWIGYPIDDPLPLMISPGGVVMLSYRNHNINEPAFYIGMSLPAQE